MLRKNEAMDRKHQKKLNWYMQEAEIQFALHSAVVKKSSPR